jgi:hypothetical protein
LKPHLSGDLLAAQQGHVLDKKSHHALALALGRRLIPPESGKVARQVSYLRLLLFTQQSAIRFQLSLVLLLRLCQ